MTKKKVTKKAQVSAKIEEAKPVAKATQRLSAEEMRLLEELTHAITSARLRIDNSNHLITNMQLKQENLQNQIAMLGQDIRVVGETINKEKEIESSKLEKLKLLGDQLKSKYGIESDALKYNPRTGELI